jgi:hypothetical protein
VVTFTEDAPSTGTEPDLATTRARLACTDVITTFFQLVDGGQASETIWLLWRGQER